MYLVIVTLLLIFVTLFHYMREGMRDVLDKSTIVATDTEVELPNRVSGNRGDDITFGGNVKLEQLHSLEFGKGVDKGDNSGKIRYNGNKLEIFGAGKTGDAYKIKLWDDVEVGGLLQVKNSVNFGKNKPEDGRIQNGTNELGIVGKGEDGTRKVKIWDEVEVGRLLSSHGMDVQGLVNAYNDVNVGKDLNVDGKITAKEGVSVIGDIEVTGHINNADLNKRLNKLDESLLNRPLNKTGEGGTPSEDITKYIDDRIFALDDKISKIERNPAIHPEIDKSMAVIDTIKEQVTDITGDIQNIQSGSPDLSVFSTTFNTSLENTKTDILKNVNDTIDAAKISITSQIESDMKSKIDNIQGAIIHTTDNIISQINVSIPDVINKSKTEIKTEINLDIQNKINAAKSDIATLINASIKDTLNKAKNEIKTEIAQTTSEQIGDISQAIMALTKSRSGPSSSGGVSKADVELMLLAQEAKINNVSLVAKAALNNTAEWIQNKTNILSTAADWSQQKTAILSTTSDWSQQKANLLATTSDWTKNKADIMGTTSDWTKNKDSLLNTASEWNTNKGPLIGTTTDWAQNREPILNTVTKWLNYDDSTLLRDPTGAYAANLAKLNATTIDKANALIPDKQASLYKLTSAQVNALAGQSAAQLGRPAPAAAAAPVSSSSSLSPAFLSFANADLDFGLLTSIGDPKDDKYYTKTLRNLSTVMDHMNWAKPNIDALIPKALDWTSNSTLVKDTVEQYNRERVDFNKAAVDASIKSLDDKTKGQIQTTNATVDNLSTYSTRTYVPLTDYNQYKSVVENKYYPKDYMDNPTNGFSKKNITDSYPSLITDAKREGTNANIKADNINSVLTKAFSFNGDNGNVVNMSGSLIVENNISVGKPPNQWKLNPMASSLQVIK